MATTNEYAVKCNECRSTVRMTANVRESYQGTQCQGCRYTHLACETHRDNLVYAYDTAMEHGRYDEATFIENLPLMVEVN